LAMSSNGGSLASGSDDFTIKIWNPHTAKYIKQLLGHTAAIRALSYSPQGDYLVSGSDDNTAIVWDTKNAKNLYTLEGHQNAVRAVAFSPDGRQIATGSWDKTIKLWNFSPNSKPTVTATLTGHEDWITCLAYSPDGKYLVSAGYDKMILWNLSTKQPALDNHSLPMHCYRGDITAVTFSPDSTLFYTGRYNGTIQAWSIDTFDDDIFISYHLDHRVNQITVSADGKNLFVASNDNAFSVFTVPKRGGEESLITYVVDFPSTAPFTSIATSSKHICTADSIGQIYILSFNSV